MPVRVRTPALILLVSLIAVGQSYAQSAATPPDPNALPVVKETVVVTATGREETISKVGASITVLTHDQIEQRHALSLIDLLRFVPGVAASRSGGIGNLTSLWVRGGESSYNKVLLDGIPLNEPGGTFNFANLSPENIDRIEVLRGAHSALFGSDAMASVIQLFSIRPDTRRPQVNLTADAGNYNTAHVSGSVAARMDAVEYSVSGSQLKTDNREPNNEDTTSTLLGTVTRTIRSGGSVRLLGRGEFGDTGSPGQTAFGRPDLDASYNHQDASVLGGWNQPLGARLLQSASYSFNSTRQHSENLLTDPPYTPRYGNRVAAFQFFDFPYDLKNDLSRHRLDYRIDATMGPAHTLTAAFAYDGERGTLRDLMSQADPLRPTRNNTGTTIQYEGAAGNLSIVTGIRFENNGSFGFYAAPRAAMSWLVHSGNGSSTRIKASTGMGIKEPTFLQSYSLSRFSLGNPDLEPEKSRGFDVGVVQQAANGRLNFEATYFANHFDNLVATREINPATFESQYFNIGETRARGLELAAGASLQGSIRVRGSYTLLDSEVLTSTTTFSPVFRAGQPLFRRPRHSGDLHAAWVKGRTSLSTDLVFVGTRVDSDFSSLEPEIVSNEAYATWALSGQVQLVPKISVFVTFENLANRDYMEPLGYPALGRTVRAGIRARF